MTRAQYISMITQDYTLVKTLAKKNDYEVLQLRNNALERDLVLRSYPYEIIAYKKLKEIVCENLPIIYDIINLDDGQIILEEFINGITVAQILQDRCYTYRGAKTVLSAVCNALCVLHSMDIIHRDIKPENVIVTPKGNIYLIDFNAARLYTENKGRDTVALGTIGYAPPEQFGISQSDKKSDIYSLGVLLNVMLTGTHPSQKLAKGKAGKIVLKCTQIDPNSRFQTAEKLIEVL